MSSNTVNFTINLNGNAYDGFLNLDRAIDDVIGSSKEVTSALNRIGRESFNFESISNVVGNISQAFGQLVGSSLDFEQQQANIKTLLNGDAEATEKLVGQLKEYSKATTYDTSSLVDAQKTMMSFGLDAEFAFGKLKNIGDIALGDGQKMQSLALAFSQMSSTGKLMGQDLNQMINAGFNPLEVISQKTGKSIATLKEEMGKGAISAEDVAQAFEWATVFFNIKFIMGKNKSILCFLICIHCSLPTFGQKEMQPNVSKYYYWTNQAELAVNSENWTMAISCYDSAFKYKKPFSTDLRAAYIISNFYLNDTCRMIKYIHKFLRCDEEKYFASSYLSRKDCVFLT